MVHYVMSGLSDDLYRLIDGQCNRFFIASNQQFTIYMYNHTYIFNINPCTAELFVGIFHSFEAGIANSISSFKWHKNRYIYEKIEISKG